MALAVNVSVVSSLGAPLIPTIARDNGVPLGTAQWILTAALLSGAVASPILGRLADGPRQRLIAIVGLCVVLGGCVVAALPVSFPVLIAARTAQGVGLGLVPVAIAIARIRLPRKRLAQTVATLSITSTVGAAVGFPLTGLVVQFADYRAAFWLGAITTGIGLVLACTVLPGRVPLVARRFDLLGAVTLSVGVVAASIWLSESGSWGWTSARSVGVAAGSVVFLAVWVWHQLRCEDPLVDLRQVRHRLVLTADVAVFLICVASYLYMPIIVELMQVPTSTGFGFGASVALSGLILVPVSIGTVIVSRLLGVYERRFGTRSMIPVGALLFAVASVFFALEHRSLWVTFGVVFISGVGVGFTFAAMPGLIVRAVPPEETGSATGFYQVLRNLGQTAGSALGALVLYAFTAPGDTYPAEGGFTVSLLLAGCFSVLTAITAYLLAGPNRRGSASAPTVVPVNAGDAAAPSDAASPSAPRRA